MNGLYLQYEELWKVSKDGTQQTFRRCFNVAFWLMRRRDVGQRPINVETTLCISTLEFTTSNQRCVFQR